MGFALSNYKAFAATVLRYDTATVKAESNFIVANAVLAELSPA
jgi:hypothetical protein